MNDLSPPTRPEIPDLSRYGPDAHPRGARPDPNHARIIRRPLIGNMMCPLFANMAWDIGLQDAIAEAMAFAQRNNRRFPDWLEHNGTHYKFLPGQGVIEYCGKQQLGKITNPFFDG